MNRIVFDLAERGYSVFFSWHTHILYTHTHTHTGQVEGGSSPICAHAGRGVLPYYPYGPQREKERALLGWQAWAQRCFVEAKETWSDGKEREEDGFFSFYIKRGTESAFLYHVSVVTDDDYVYDDNDVFVRRRWIGFGERGGGRAASQFKG